MSAHMALERVNQGVRVPDQDCRWRCEPGGHREDHFVGQCTTVGARVVHHNEQRLEHLPYGDGVRIALALDRYRAVRFLYSYVVSAISRAVQQTYGGARKLTLSETEACSHELLWREGGQVEGHRHRIPDRGSDIAQIPRGQRCRVARYVPQLTQEELRKVGVSG